MKIKVSKKAQERIKHEINNPLTIALCNARNLKKKRVRNISELDKIEEQLIRIAKVVDSLEVA